MKTKIILFTIAYFTIYTTQSQVPYPLSWGDTTMLYICPFNSADSLQWGPLVDITAGNGATNQSYGMPNTIAIVEQLGDNGGVPYPAKICDTLTAFGYTDWYLPSLWELYKMAKNQDSIGNPIDCFWGSYEHDSISAYRMIMSNGFYEGTDDYKLYQYSCRCIRREYINTSSNSDKLIKELKIIPDPASKEVNIKIKGLAGDYELSIYNIQGVRMESRKINVTGKGYSGKVDVSQYAKGTYIVKIRNGKAVKTEKFVL